MMKLVLIASLFAAGSLQGAVIFSRVADNLNIEITEPLVFESTWTGSPGHMGIRFPDVYSLEQTQAQQGGFLEPVPAVHLTGGDGVQIVNATSYAFAGTSYFSGDQVLTPGGKHLSIYFAGFAHVDNPGRSSSPYLREGDSIVIPAGNYLSRGFFLDDVHTLPDQAIDSVFLWRRGGIAISDNLSLVPEPSSMTFLGSALFLFLFHRIPRSR
jgi:hypothetical protein